MTYNLQLLPNITKIADKYDYFILDVWGVIHDGSHTYEGVVERLKHLRQLGKKICFLSNAPRRSSKVAGVLKNFGINEDLYDFIITSGEATYLFLHQNEIDPNHLKNLTNHDVHDKYFYIGPSKDADLLNGLGYKPSQNANEASFVVATGFDNETSTLEEKLPQLLEAKKHNLPMICVNPDLIVVKQNGSQSICAGLLALEYQKMGGKVVYFGKPYSLVYEQVFQLFSNPNKTKVLAIGDGLETDILGANQNGIDSAFVAGGVFAKELKIKHGQLPDKDLTQQICNQYQAFPTFVIGRL
jgi:HAD superfamily hydrolase (TIGR01459 family)